MGNLVWESNTNLENSNTKHKRSSKEVGLTASSVFIVNRDVFVDRGSKPSISSPNTIRRSSSFFPYIYEKTSLWSTRNSSEMLLDL